MTAFLVLVMFVIAYRLNRDEAIIVDLQERVEQMERLEQLKQEGEGSFDA